MLNKLSCSIGSVTFVIYDESHSHQLKKQNKSKENMVIRLKIKIKYSDDQMGWMSVNFELAEEHRF